MTIEPKVPALDSEELTGSDVALPPALEQAIQKLTREQQGRVRAFFLVQWQRPTCHRSEPRMTDAHIKRVLALEEKTLRYTHEDRQNARRWGTIAGFGLATLAVLVILVLALTGHEALLSELIPLAAAFVGGTGAGLGFAKTRQGP